MGLAPSDSSSWKVRIDRDSRVVSILGIYSHGIMQVVERLMIPPLSVYDVVKRISLDRAKTKGPLASFPRKRQNSIADTIEDRCWLRATGNRPDSRYRGEEEGKRCSCCCVFANRYFSRVLDYQTRRISRNGA